jgi:hypothetical protein
MATQVTCITKREHQNAHERIVGIGGSGWWRSEDDAIRDVERDPQSYWTSANGVSVWVIVAVHNGRKYLKTTADGYKPDNLLSLSDCPK